MKPLLWFRCGSFLSSRRSVFEAATYSNEVAASPFREAVGFPLRITCCPPEAIRLAPTCRSFHAARTSEVWIAKPCKGST